MQWECVCVFAECKFHLDKRFVLRVAELVRGDRISIILVGIVASRIVREYCWCIDGGMAHQMLERETDEAAV